MMTNLQAVTQTYRMNQIAGASPLDLLIMAYDAALASCGQKDLARLTKAIGVLRDALDYSYDADVALGFFRLYQYIGDLGRQGKYDEAADLLRELRDAWAEIREQHQPAVAPVAQSRYSAPVGQMASATSGVVLAG